MNLRQTISRIALSLCVGAVAMGITSAASALDPKRDGHAARGHYSVHQQQRIAREAYRRGEIKSLSVIRQNVITTYNGRIISTQFRTVRSSTAAPRQAPPDRGLAAQVRPAPNNGVHKAAGGPRGATRYLYKFRVLSGDGRVMTVHVDARDARIIKVEGQPAGGER